LSRVWKKLLERLPIFDLCGHIQEEHISGRSIRRIPR